MFPWVSPSALLRGGIGIRRPFRNPVASNVRRFPAAVRSRSCRSGACRSPVQWRPALVTTTAPLTLSWLHLVVVLLCDHDGAEQCGLVEPPPWFWVTFEVVPAGDVVSAWALQVGPFPCFVLPSASWAGDVHSVVLLDDGYALPHGAPSALVLAVASRSDVCEALCVGVSLVTITHPAPLVSASQLSACLHCSTLTLFPRAQLTSQP